MMSFAIKTKIFEIHPLHEFQFLKTPIPKICVIPLTILEYPKFPKNAIVKYFRQKYRHTAKPSKTSFAELVGTEKTSNRRA